MKPIVIAALLLALSGASAAAQTTLPFRAFISVDGAMQVGANDFQGAGSFIEHAEEGRFDTDYSVSNGPAFNIGGGVRLLERLGVGVGVTRFSKSTPTQLNASVPHPFFFNQGRDVSGEVGGLTREELAVHVRASYLLVPAGKVQVIAFGGPSFFKVTQDIVADFSYSETYPYDAATFTAGQAVTANESTIGFNAGVDVGYFFTERLGVGGLVQFSGATLDFDTTGGAQDVKTGGLQAGGGLRLRF